MTSRIASHCRIHTCPVFTSTRRREKLAYDRARIEHVSTQVLTSSRAMSSLGEANRIRKAFHHHCCTVAPGVQTSSRVVNLVTARHAPEKVQARNKQAQSVCSPCPRYVWKSQSRRLGCNIARYKRYEVGSLSPQTIRVEEKKRRIR